MAGLVERFMPHAFPVREGQRIQELIGHQAAIAGLPCDHMDVGYGFQISVLCPADGQKLAAAVDSTFYQATFDRMVTNSSAAVG